MSADAARRIVQTWADERDVPLPAATATAPAPVVDAPTPADAATTAQPSAPSAAATTDPAAKRLAYVFILDGPTATVQPDAATLTQWSAEGRLHENMRFEEQGTGRVLQAREVPGLFITRAPRCGRSPCNQQPGAQQSGQACVWSSLISSSSKVRPVNRISKRRGNRANITGLVVKW